MTTLKRSPARLAAMLAAGALAVAPTLATGQMTGVENGQWT